MKWLCLKLNLQVLTEDYVYTSGLKCLHVLSYCMSAYFESVLDLGICILLVI